MKTCIPEGYKSILGIYDTQMAIGLLHRLFEDNLSAALNIYRVSAPLFVESNTGLNDDLNGVERPVSFQITGADAQAQVVQSLAKWKRLALHRYRFYPGKGIYTDMNAIRKDEAVLDNLHSVYVDQWDWEKIITERDRTIDYLKSTVIDIIRAIYDTQDTLQAIYPRLMQVPKVSKTVKFVTAQELEDRWPDISPKERENRITKEFGTVFLIGIGGKMRSGERHDGRSPDYDDWNMNGDILLWNDLLGCAVEISSMGVRVDSATLRSQLREAQCEHRSELLYHRMLLNDELPLSIGGGIGQSRLSMVLLGKIHIGEVQASVWDAETLEACRAAGVLLL